jgi:hypothetical protein
VIDISIGSGFDDYTLTFVHDLTGNRVQQTKVTPTSSGGSSTETTSYLRACLQKVVEAFSSLLSMSAIMVI